MRRRQNPPLVLAACVSLLSAMPQLYAQNIPDDQSRQHGQTPPATPSGSVVSSADKLMPLAVFINGSPGGQWVLLERKGILFAPEEAIAEWRLDRQPGIPTVTFRGQQWVSLTTIPGYEARFNYAEQSVELKFSPRAFAATRLAEQTAIRPQLTPAAPALFANYDLSYTGQTFRQAPGDHQLGALTELGLSGDAGVLTSSYVGQNITGSSSLQPPSWRRLETTYTRDLYDSGLTLKLGDSTTRRGTWGRPAYFGGVQIGSNFGLTPGFISQPIPLVQGTSSAPSTVELYVNDVLRQTSRVPTGPFTIDNFPLLTSSGDARIVVRDALGRETVIDQPFFSHPSMLEQGLSDWSLEYGAVRRNLGVVSYDYGQRFSSGMLRHGLSKTLTVEVQGEHGQDTRDAGLGISAALPWQMLGQAAISASRDRFAGDGRDWVLALHRSTLRQNFALNYERATLGYRQIAMGTTLLPYRMQLTGNYSYTLDDELGSVAVGMARIATYGSGTLTTYSGNYSTRVAHNGSLTFTLARVTGTTPGSSIGVSLLLPLDGQTNFSSNLTHKDGRDEGYVSASKNLGNDSGTGWRALAGNRTGQNYAEGGVYYQGDHGLLTGDASASMQQQTVRLGAQGGLVMIGGHAFMTRRVQNSFALVEVPGYADVGINFQNSTWTHTDEDGIALLPRLLPYQRNSIQLDPGELPISAELDSIEQVVVPASRTGVKVVFPVRQGRGALIHIMTDWGGDAPPGAVVTVEGDNEEFYVARHGQAFVTGLKDENTLHLKAGDRECSFHLTLPPSNPDAITRIGPVTCKR